MNGAGGNRPPWVPSSDTRAARDVPAGVWGGWLAQPKLAAGVGEPGSPATFWAPSRIQ